MDKHNITLIPQEKTTESSETLIYFVQSIHLTSSEFTSGGGNLKHDNDVYPNGQSSYYIIIGQNV